MRIPFFYAAPFLVQLLFVVLFMFVGEYLAGYILGVAFGSTTPWDELHTVIRHAIGLFLFHPIFVVAVLVFIAALFVPVPFF